MPVRLQDGSAAKQGQVGSLCGESGMISFETDTAETARKVLSGVRIILYAESLGEWNRLLHTRYCRHMLTFLKMRGKPE